MASIDLMKGMKTLITAVGLILSFMILIVVAVLVGGVLINAVTGGSITVSSGFNTVLNSLDTTTSAWFTTLATAGTTAVGLVIVVFLVVLFRKYIKSGNSGKGGSNF